MVAEQITLPAATGRTIGTRSSRRLRTEGRIPAVVYGNDTDPMSVAVEWSDLRAALTTDAGMNALITLDVEGDEKLTIVKDMQRHPVRRDIIHVDFIVIDRNKPLDVEVPIHLVDTDGHNLDGLVLDQQLFSLPISAKPDAIPNEFAVSCAELTLETPVRAGDLTLPAGVELDIDPEETVASASIPQVFVEETPAEAEGDEAEGDAGEGAEASAEGDDGASDGGDEG